ncbi:hypothetical protein RQP46_009278 [Phenoliferia psychrophenolica]
MVGSLINVFLCGITMSQAHQYFFHCRNDKPFYQISVAVLYVIGIVHTITSAYSIYDRSVLHFGDNASLLVAGWGLESGATFTGVTALIVQTSLASCGFAVACTYLGAKAAMLPQFGKFTPAVLAWLFLALASDFLITISLVYYLKVAGTKTNFDETKSLLRLVATNVVENNLLTAVTALIDAILFLALKAPWHVALNSFLAKLYFMSLLASLNSRRRFAEISKRRISTATGGGGYSMQGAQDRPLATGPAKISLFKGIKKVVSETGNRFVAPSASQLGQGSQALRESGSRSEPFQIKLTR